MSKNDIRLSPKYGVNPTIPICFWCGEEKNEVALMGRIGDGRKGEDFEAPRNMVLDYEPCEECQKKWSTGVALLEASTTPNHEKQPAMGNGYYPTGRWLVLMPEAFERIFNQPVPKRASLVDQEVFGWLLSCSESST